MKNETVGIVEYWNRNIPIYEVMLEEEFEKKMKGIEYNVLRKSETIPFIEFGEPKDASWLGLKTHISLEEFNNKFS